MYRVEHTRGGRGFTLVEILIVVVVIGILAAIVVPQFTNAASGARATSMRTQLVSMRNQIQIFRVRNSQSTPGGSGGSLVDLWNALITARHIQVAPSTSDGFVWIWNPENSSLGLNYDEGINPYIPDADGDGDGDADDIIVIQAW